jgi:CTP synthase
MGGTMRLGAYPCRLQPKTQAAKAYGEKVIFERHRHRYEFNNQYRELFAQMGMVFSGLSPDGLLVRWWITRGFLARGWTAGISNEAT